MKMLIQKGCDFSAKFRLRDKDGNVIKLTDANFIRFRVKNDLVNVDLCFPKVTAVDEVQQVSFDATPTVGTFKLSHDGNVTGLLNFDDTSTTVQTALRALKSLNNVTVTGSITSPTGLTVTYVTKDGGREQPLLVVSDNTLLAGVTDVVVTVTETIKGVGEHGIEITDGEKGIITVLGSENEAGLYATGVDQDATLKVRIAAQDLAIKKLLRFLDVESEL